MGKEVVWSTRLVHKHAVVLHTLSVSLQLHHTCRETTYALL